MVTATPTLPSRLQRPHHWHLARPGPLLPAQARSAPSEATGKAHRPAPRRPRSRRGAGRGPPRLRSTPSRRPCKSGRTQQHVTIASIQDGGRGQARQAPRLSPSPAVRPLGVQAQGLGR